ncbi:MAG: hypothetical protein N2491_08505 [Negativicutes bacterium]|nr:hypothetical protein [Negativicutes bacterium]
MRQYIAKSGGFTYIELLISMTIALLLFAGVFGLLSTSLLSWRTGSSRIEAQQTARAALEAMTREIRYDARDIITANGNSSTLRYHNSIGETIEFYREGNVLYRRVTSVSGLVNSPNPITEGTVSFLNFTVADSADFTHKVIRIRLMVTVPNPQQSFELSTMIVALNT